MSKRRWRKVLWWAHFRLRWRRRSKGAGAHFVEVGFTSGIVVGGILTATSDAADSTKVAIGILLGVAEIVFLFAKAIHGEVRRLGERSLNVLPNNLPSTISHHLDNQRANLLSRATELSENKLCDLEKHEMYATLINLTDTVTTRYAGTLSAAILAVSGTDIDDFEREILAQEYLDANKRAAAALVVVRRLFLLDANQLNSRKVRAIMKKHEDALSARADAGSAVKWLAKSAAGVDRDLDFALFANEALVRQVYRPGGAKGELTVNGGQIEPALAAFERLWDHPRVRAVGEYDDGTL
jgi:hypothetical protein